MWIQYWIEPWSSDNWGPFSRRWETHFFFVFLNVTFTCWEQPFSHTKVKVSSYEQLILASMPGKSLRRFRKDNNKLEKPDGCILNFCKWQKKTVNGQRPSTIYVYVCMYSLFQLKYWRLEYLKIFEWFCFNLKYKSFVKFSKQKFVLSRSFLNFLRIFCKLKGEFLWVWETFAPPPGNLAIIFCPGAGN